MSPLIRTCLAISAVVAATVTVPCAHAVYLDPDGRGQALIYPYYTVQSVSGNPFNTYISVVNGALDAKVIRVRFREGRNGREVAGFHLYLDSGDTWAAAIVPSASGARLITVDQSCVNGAFVVDGAPVPMRTYEFTNAGYAGAADDGLGTGLDRAREGLVEMIEMATLTGNSLRNVSLPFDPYFSTVPSNCPAVQGATVSLETAAPTGGLSGTLTLVNVAKGMDFTVNAVALAELTTQSFYRDVGDPYPDFDANEVTPVSHLLAGGKSHRATWATGVEAVASVLTAKSIRNETVLDAGTRSETDWIITLPLRRFQLPSAIPPTTFPTSYPPASNAGLPVRLIWVPRDGRGFMFAGGSDISPRPGGWIEVLPRIPWAATVMSFSRGVASAATLPSSTVLGSTNAVMMTLPTTAQNGAGMVDFSGYTSPWFVGTSMRISDGAVSAGTRAFMEGVPAIGFMVRTLENGQLTCAGTVCQGNYGGSFPHASDRRVLP